MFARVKNQLQEYMNFPAVSVVVNSYNSEKFLARAFDSVIKQTETFNDFEVIIIDDCSTDSTPEIIKSYASKFEAVGIPYTAMALAENSGSQSEPKNMAIIHSIGDFIRFLDADNEFTEGSLRTLYDAALDGDIWPDVVYGRRNYILDSEFTDSNRLKTGPSDFVEFDAERLAQGPHANFIDTSDALIARGAFWWLYHNTEMFWNESYRRFGDWELFCRMANMDKLVAAASPRFKAVDAIVTNYHWHGENLQLTRPAIETPFAVSGITGKRI